MFTKDDDATDDFAVYLISSSTACRTFVYELP